MTANGYKNLKIDIGLLFVAVVALIFGFISLYCSWLSLSYISIFGVDLYLFAVVLTAAVRADAKPRGESAISTYEFEWKAEWLFPSRRAGVVVIPIMVVALIVAFAGLYSALPAGNFLKEFAGTCDALYFSLVTLTTVGYGDFAPITPFARGLVMFQIASGFLVLVAAFPLLISRVSDF
jgi:voltage-gated potassium channel Kch